MFQVEVGVIRKMVEEESETRKAFVQETFLAQSTLLEKKFNDIAEEKGKIDNSVTTKLDASWVKRTDIIEGPPCCTIEIGNLYGESYRRPGEGKACEQEERRHRRLLVARQQRTSS